MKKILTIFLLSIVAITAYTQSKYDITSINFYDGNGYIDCKGTFVVSKLQNSETITIYDEKNKPILSIIAQETNVYVDKVVIYGVTPDLHPMIVHIYTYRNYNRIVFIDKYDNKVSILTSINKK